MDKVPFVVRTRYRAEGFLTSLEFMTKMKPYRVSNLQFDRQIIYFYLLGSELDADCGVVVRFEGVVHESEEEA
jgi:hypothetical protein